MNLKIKKLPNVDNISKTGYRALFVLMKLIHSPETRAALIECLAQEPFFQKEVNKDTITNTINGLKKAGCIISRPSPKTDNKYVLKYHPFTINFSQKEIDALQSFREEIISIGNWEFLLQLNSLYSKLGNLTNDEIQKAILLYNHPLNKINTKILRNLIFAITCKQLLNIKYKSPQEGEENFDIIPKAITLENEKLYIWCYSFKYDETAYLRIDRILGINSYTFDKTIAEKKDESKRQEMIVEYELKGIAQAMYISSDDETILSENQNETYPLRIKAVVKNKFNFIQKIMSYGTDCRIISPDDLKTEYLDTLKKIKLRYTNE